MKLLSRIWTAKYIKLSDFESILNLERLYDFSLVTEVIHIASTYQYNRKDDRCTRKFAKNHRNSCNAFDANYLPKYNEIQSLGDISVDRKGVHIPFCEEYMSLFGKADLQVFLSDLFSCVRGLSFPFLRNYFLYLGINHFYLNFIDVTISAPPMLDPTIEASDMDIAYSIHRRISSIKARDQEIKHSMHIFSMFLDHLSSHIIPTITKHFEKALLNMVEQNIDEKPYDMCNIYEDMIKITDKYVTENKKEILKCSDLYQDEDVLAVINNIRKKDILDVGIAVVPKLKSAIEESES